MKGISPFIALVLIIAITLVAGGLVASWHGTLIKTQTQIVAQETTEEIECQPYGGIRILEETIQCDFTGDTDNDYLNFTVENSGSINLYALTTQIYLEGMTYAYNTYEARTNLSFTSSYPLQPNERKTVIVNLTGVDLPSADADWIRIITRCPGVVHQVKDVDCA